MARSRQIGDGRSLNFKFWNFPCNLADSASATIDKSKLKYTVNKKAKTDHFKGKTLKAKQAKQLVTNIMYTKATEITLRIQNMTQLVWKRMLFAEDLTRVFPARLCVVVPRDGATATGLLHRSPWQHVISQFVIPVPFFMAAFVIFLIASPHAAFTEHARVWTTTSPLICTFPVRVIVTQESFPGSLHPIVAYGWWVAHAT